MEKIREYGKYLDTVREYQDFFKSYYFHSIIDLNLVKLDYILKYGILSKKLIEKNDLARLYTHNANDYDSKNGSTYVSLTQYTDKTEFSTLFEAFPLHTLTSLSLLVNKDIEVKRKGERETFFEDEIFCANLVPITNLEGIILPDNLSNLPISEVNCLSNDLASYTKSGINRWITDMQKYFKNKLPLKEISEIKLSHKRFWDILEEYENPDRWVSSAAQTQRSKYGEDIKDVLARILERLWSEKLNLQNPTFIEIVKILNNNQLPIYEIKEKSLKKIN